MKKILVVDDEKNIVDFIKMNLEMKSYNVISAYDGTEAVIKAVNEIPDCILLDLMLPKIDGKEVCKILRADAKTASIPIIMLTAKGEEDDIVSGFMVGADDYITKPFSIRELFVRIEALMRRTDIDKTDENISIFQDIKLYRDKFIIEKSGVRIDLTPSECDILNELFNKKGAVATRERLNEILGIVDETNRTLDVHIRNLRKKLGDDAQKSRYIETVRGVGFRLNE